MPECGMYSGERSASRVQIRHDRSVARELRGISDNRHPIADFRHHLNGAIEQSAAAELEEGLVGAHAGTLPSCKDEARARKLGLRVHDFLAGDFVRDRTSKKHRSWPILH